jgi:hypothetical protein
LFWLQDGVGAIGADDDDFKYDSQIIIVFQFVLIHLSFSALGIVDEVSEDSQKKKKKKKKKKIL